MSPDQRPAFALEAHPAERGRRQTAVTLCAGCCSCCCCLHTVGGLVGAATGSVGDSLPLRGSREFNPFRKSTPSVAGLYWGVLGLLGVGAVAWGVWASEGRSDGIGAGLCIFVFLLPAMQLGASVLTALYVVLDRRYEDKAAYLGSLGRITAQSLLGALAGLALMFVGCVGCVGLAALSR